MQGHETSLTARLFMRPTDQMQCSDGNQDPVSTIPVPVHAFSRLRLRMSDTAGHRSQPYFEHQVRPIPVWKTRRQIWLNRLF
jgi:hypothetical protein